MGTEQHTVGPYLADAEADVRAAEVLLAEPDLASSGNRQAAFHLQQAAEKLTKAVRVHRGLAATKEHRIDQLVMGVSVGEPQKLPDADPWIGKLMPLDPLSEYATAFRYPSTSGRLKAGPDSAAVKGWIARIRSLIKEARAELLIK